MKTVKIIILISITFTSLIFSQIEYTVKFDDFKFKISNYFAKDKKTYSLIETNSYFSFLKRRR